MSMSGMEMRLGLCGVGSSDGGVLDLVPIRPPPSLVARWKVGPAAISPDLAVDQLAKHVGVAGMSSDVDDHVDQRLVKRELASALRPPRHLTHGVEREGIDRRVGMGPSPATEFDDAVSRLIGSHPHVAVGLAILHPGQRFWKRPAEH